MVLVRGRVTLELQTNKTNIRMESQRIEVTHCCPLLTVLLHVSNLSLGLSFT